MKNRRCKLNSESNVYNLRQRANENKNKTLKNEEFSRSASCASKTSGKYELNSKTSTQSVTEKKSSQTKTKYCGGEEENKNIDDVRSTSNSSNSPTCDQEVECQLAHNKGFSSRSSRKIINYDSEDEYIPDQSSTCGYDPPRKPRPRVTDEIGPDGKWQIRTYAGYIVTVHINLDRDKPEYFASDDAAIMWHTANEINLIRLKHQVQNAEYIPDDAIIEVDPFPLKQPKSYYKEMTIESEEIRRDKVNTWNSQKKAALQREFELVTKAIAIRECFTGDHQIREGLALMDEMLKLNTNSLMLKKHPYVVDTVLCLCVYEGPLESEVVDSLVTDVQKKAQEIKNKFKSLFKIPNGIAFEDLFKEHTAFLWRVHGFDFSRVYELVNDPTLAVVE